MTDIPDYAIYGRFAKGQMCPECGCCGLLSSGYCLGECMKGWHICDGCSLAVPPHELYRCDASCHAGHADCMGKMTRVIVPADPNTGLVEHVECSGNHDARTFREERWKVEILSRPKIGKTKSSLNNSLD